MLAWTLAFSSGIVFLLQFSDIPSYWVYISIPIFSLLTICNSKFKILLIFCIGFCWAFFRIDLMMTNDLKPYIEGKTILLNGVVTSLPSSHDDHIKFLFKVDHILDKKMSLTEPILVRLNWYKTKTIPAPGERWQFKAKLKRPYGFMNSGGFDYETWVLRQGIKATGYIKNSKLNKKQLESESYYFERLRHILSDRIKSILDKPLLGLVLALSIGDRSQLTAEQWQVFKNTGTSHLIAISGLHLGLITGFIYFLVNALWRRSHHATLLMPAPIVAIIVAFLGAVIYAGLAGFSLPTQRALIMIGVYLISLFAVKKILPLNVVCIAIILILINDPLSIVAVDFWLSFTAVILILFITQYRLDKLSNLNRWLKLQCLLSIAIMPVIIFWFKQIPVYSVLANAVAIPVIGFLIVPITFLATFLIFLLPEFAIYLYSLVEKINDISWSYLHYLSQQQYAVVSIPASHIGAFFLALVGVLILIMPRGLPARWVGLFYLLPLLFPQTPRLQPDEFKLTQLDVGQGLSALIETQNHVLVYDTGARFSERFNIGDAVLIPYLRAKGFNELSMLMISHGDNDHIGGANALIKRIKINRILTSTPEKFSVDTEICTKGNKWIWDEVVFEILHPALESNFIGNNASCVLKVSSRYGTVMLTGDIEKQAEKSLLADLAQQLKADILLVPHHGSKTSSTSEFINAVNPDYAFFSAGYNNRFGFPKQDIIERYKIFGVETLISFETGELSANFDKSGLIVEQFRQKRRRFWHH